MNKATIVEKHSVARIEYVPRLTLAKTKVKPLHNKEQYSSIANTNTIVPESLQTVSPECVSIDQSNLKNIDDNTDRLKSEKLSSPNTPKSSLSSTNNKQDLIKQAKNFRHRFIDWFNIIPPFYIFIIRKTRSESSFTNITASSCSSSTCIGKETPYRTSIVTALYPFDGNTNDQSGYYTGTAFGTSSPSFSSQAYVGQSINLNPSAQQQYIQISNLNLSKQSFTLQTWIYPGTNPASIDLGIFSQCDSNSICLSFSLRSGRFVLSFDSMNVNNISLTGSTIISQNQWIHVTVVYDAVLFQQQIYVDGQIDAISYGMINSYQGDLSSSTTTTIGRSSSYARGTTYFQGRIDHFTISAGVARSACQIYNDASLVVYYPFDTTGAYNDHSVNLCNGLASGTTIVSSGRINEAISFTSSTSYFQSQCFSPFRNNNRLFSFSLWINPTSTTGGGTIVHLSSNSYGNSTCYDPLVFTSTGALVCQWMTSGPTVSGVQGPLIPANTWTHVAVVYGFTNGVRLFINGQFSTSSTSGSLSLVDPNTNIWYITLGNKSPLGSSASVNCQSGSITISSGSFLGSIDEFRLYNRELNNQEICVLANL
ncbi:unnamed protein product [Rotaria sp. Silwood1]|nr:unnamed protein product [Rotaria sp. Silwood1]CAF4955544.1 unnamed protein product [Rotaria sp. Silwood1]